MSKQLFQYRSLLQRLKAVIKLSKDIDSTAPGVLELVARRFEYDWAAYWKVDFEHQVLRAIAIWNEDSGPLKPLIRDAERRAFTLGEGAPGRVWKSSEPFCTGNLIQDMCLPRSLHARAAGLSFGIWFPIRANKKTSGIIELLGKRSWPGDQKLLDELLMLGKFIGKQVSESEKP